MRHWYLRAVTPELSEITEKALRLPQDEQLRLARTLLESNEASGDFGVDAAWEQEIERRIQMIDDGLAKGRPFAAGTAAARAACLSRVDFRRRSQLPFPPTA